ncbi:MAG: HAD family hydrolase [Candidatus Bathyarchaeia archaeon]
MSPAELRGVVFDLDGTLVKSDVDFSKMKRRMIALLEENGVPPALLTPTETTVVIMEKAEKVWDEKGMPAAERERVRAEIADIMNETELEAVETVEEVEGAAEAVRTLKERGYKLAVLTRGHHDYAVRALRKTGMLEHFDLVLGREETPRPKPYAEALEHTAKLMGLKPSEILFVGDHPIDSTSADNARVQFIAVVTGRTDVEAWAEHGQETILCSVRELPDFLAERRPLGSKTVRGS